MVTHNVIVYSTATCPACAAAKAHLDEIGQKYKTVDVGTDEKGREEMMKKAGGLLSVPTIDIDGEIVVGFDKAKIDELLK